ncbi:hypothetical protein COLO4_28728 [Corchorus olitorius]|uniref:Uncharacterized protein n=1 Tax=Corchorus olitorius TaxID=93759 RepID=A0A1R3HIS9_9ROSI|nr:hypothetical protein COLO4_28728 [Corchorus olitorius]
MAKGEDSTFPSESYFKVLPKIDSPKKPMKPTKSVPSLLGSILDPKIYPSVLE